MSDKLRELTNPEIEEIKKLHNAGKRHSWIAHKYGLRKKKLSQIVFTEEDDNWKSSEVVGMYCTSCKPIVEKKLNEEKAVK